MPDLLLVLVGLAMVSRPITLESLASGCVDMLTLSKADAQRVAANLKRWSERPIAASNLQAVGISLVTVAMMILAASRTPDPGSAMRGMAIVLVVIQSIAHVVTTGMLQVLIALRVNEAEMALASYRDPRRLSGLDMAMMWMVVALATPFVVE